MDILGNYKIESLSKIGEGAFGYVEKVNLYNLDDKLCGVYARKVLSPVDEIIKNVTVEEIKRRFTREVIYQSNLAYGNVASVYLFDKNAQNPYFIMELALSSLDFELYGNELTNEDKINCIKMVLEGLKVIHDKGYLHRDIKLQNILKFEGGVYKISDFGLVKNTSSTDTTALTAIGQAMGTRKYMAPEILYNAEYSKQTDIYAVGQVMEDLRIEGEQFQNIMKKCKALDKKQRYQDVEDILFDFINSVPDKMEA